MRNLEKYNLFSMLKEAVPKNLDSTAKEFIQKYMDLLTTRNGAAAAECQEVVQQTTIDHINEFTTRKILSFDDFISTSLIDTLIEEAPQIAKLIVELLPKAKLAFSLFSHTVLRRRSKRKVDVIKKFSDIKFPKIA